MRLFLRGLLGTVVVLTTVVAAPAVAGAQDDDADYCTLVPDDGRYFDFADACRVHDECYLERPYGNSRDARRRCDGEFYDDMIDSCRDDWPGRSNRGRRWSCYGVAGLYYVGVRTFGGFGWSDGADPALAEVA